MMDDNENSDIVHRKGLLSDFLHIRRTRKVAPYIRGEVLDIGCGSASTYVDHEGAISHYTGIDADPEIVNRLKQSFPEATFYTKNIDTDALDMSERFDIILLVAVIEHVYNQRHLFEQMIRVLKPNGRIVITSPTPFGNDVILRLGSAVGLFYKEKGINDHKVIYNKQRFSIIERDFDLLLEHYERFQLGCNQLAVFQKKHDS